MMASDRDYYPEGTDLSYFDKDSTDIQVKCPACNEQGNQLVHIDGYSRHLEGECEECGHTWEDEWTEEPDYDFDDRWYKDWD